MTGKRKIELKRLKKPCKRCDKMFIPTGATCFLCDECCEKARPTWGRKK